MNKIKTLIKRLAVYKAVISEMLEDDNPEIFLGKKSAAELSKLLGEAIEDLKMIVNTDDDGK